jgi:hypothetical protein
MQRINEWRSQSFASYQISKRCLHLVLQYHHQPAAPFFAADELIASLRNTARARLNPEASGLP